MLVLHTGGCNVLSVVFEQRNSSWKLLPGDSDLENSESRSMQSIKDPYPIRRLVLSTVILSIDDYRNIYSL